jgi:hypothetical protein
MIFDDDATCVMACAAGISKPRVRTVLQVAREIELTEKIASTPRRLGKPKCRIVDGCAVYAFPNSRVVRNPNHPRQHDQSREAATPSW